jgi:cytochrome c-type biogenesis protein
VGALVVVVGVAFASGQTSGEVTVQLAERSRSPAGFFAFGVTYGLAAAGCSAPVFVGVALAGVSRGPLVAAAVVGTYALGLVLALGAVTLAAALGHTAVVDRLRASTGRITRVAGVLLVVAGLAQIHYAVTVANALA